MRHVRWANVLNFSIGGLWRMGSAEDCSAFSLRRTAAAWPGRQEWRQQLRCGRDDETVELSETVSQWNHYCLSHNSSNSSSVTTSFYVNGKLVQEQTIKEENRRLERTQADWNKVFKNQRFRHNSMGVDELGRKDDGKYPDKKVTKVTPWKRGAYLVHYTLDMAPRQLMGVPKEDLIFYTGEIPIHEAFELEAFKHLKQEYKANYEYFRDKFNFDTHTDALEIGRARFREREPPKGGCTRSRRTGILLRLVASVLGFMIPVSCVLITKDRPGNTAVVLRSRKKVLCMRGLVCGCVLPFGIVMIAISGAALRQCDVWGNDPVVKWSWAYLHGVVDEARVYNRALPPGEIEQLAGAHALTNAWWGKGLVAYYPLDNFGIAYDRSGHGHHCTMHGTALTLDAFGAGNSTGGGAALLQGDGSYIECPPTVTASIASPDNSRTICMYARSSSASGIGLWSYGSMYDTVERGDDGEWHHFCLVYEAPILAPAPVYEDPILAPAPTSAPTRTAGQVALYIDAIATGVSSDETMLAELIDLQNAQFDLGRYWPNGRAAEPTYLQQGGIDEVTIYNRALDDAEIRALYDGLALWGQLSNWPDTLSMYSGTTRPTELPTSMPTPGPTRFPTSLPTSVPTPMPTPAPTTALPTSMPTVMPTPGPTTSPTSLPTPMPTSIPTLVCFEEEDYDYWGNDIIGESADLVDCCGGCAVQAGCVAWTYNIDNSWCYYKKSAAGRVSTSGAVSGTLSGAGGWYVGAAGASCDTACATQGLICTEEQLYANDGDVDSEDEVLTVAEEAGFEVPSSCDDGYGTNSDVPVVFSSSCYYSSSGRALSTFDCSRETNDDKYRLCYCFMQ